MRVRMMDGMDGKCPAQMHEAVVPVIAKVVAGKRDEHHQRDRHTSPNGGGQTRNAEAVIGAPDNGEDFIHISGEEQGPDEPKANGNKGVGYGAFGNRALFAKLDEC